jgi:hypothetical protein
MGKEDAKTTRNQLRSRAERSIDDDWNSRTKYRKTENN